MKIFSKSHGVTINLSTEAVLRAIFLVVAAIFLLRFVGNISYQLTLIGISAFLALALNPAVSWLSHRLHIKARVWATGLAYLIVVVVLGFFLYLVVPPLIRQSSDFINNVPNSLNELKNGNSAPAKFVQRYNLQDRVDEISQEAQNRLDDAPHAIVGVATRVGGAIISVITILVLTFMMLVEGPLWLQRFAALTPDDKRQDYKELAGKMYRVITGYVNGQVLIAFIAATFAMITLIIASTILGVTINAVAMAGIVFMFGLIPLIGNTIAAVIVVLLSLFVSTPLAIIMAIYFPIYQQIENATLQPHIQARANQLTPLVVFVAALLGAGFGGLIGAFIAIPLAGCLRLALEYHFGQQLVPTTDSVKKRLD